MSKAWIAAIAGMALMGAGCQDSAYSEREEEIRTEERSQETTLEEDGIGGGGMADDELQYEQEPAEDAWVPSDDYEAPVEDGTGGAGIDPPAEQPGDTGMIEEDPAYGPDTTTPQAP